MRNENLPIFKAALDLTVYIKMNLEEIKHFLSVQASFASHIQHANSYNLMNKVGVINESNPFDYDRT